MTYVSKYEMADVAPVTTDLIVSFFIALGSLAVVLALVVIWRYFMKK